MNQHSIYPASEIVVFSYFDLTLFFKAEDTTPLIVYARHNDRLNAAKIHFKNGIFQKIEMRPVPDMPALEAAESTIFLKIIEDHLSEIINRWIDCFVYRKGFLPEVIKKKIEVV